MRDLQIIMANLPPPNHAADLLEDEPVHPESAPIVPEHAPVQPERYLSDVEEEEDPEEEPEERLEPELEHGFAQFTQPTLNNNMNGWLVGDDNKEEEVDEMEDDEMDVDNDEDDVKVVHPYEEADPLNQPPPDSDVETVFARATAPVTSSTLQPLPPIRQFSGTFYIGEGSSAKAFNADNCRVSRSGPLGCNMETLRSKVKTLDKQMYDRKEKDIRAENSELREMLRSAQARADYHHETFEFYRYRSARIPYDPAADPARMIRSADPYVIARDAATTYARYDGDDADTPRDQQLSEPYGSPRDSQILPSKKMTQAAIDKLVADKVAEAIARVCATRRNTGGSSGNTGRNRDQELLNYAVGSRGRKVYSASVNVPRETRFNELVLLCPEAVTSEKKKVKAYIRGLLENIKGETTSSKPVILNDVVRMAHTLLE
ncbi:hypothetical protein Tco_1327403 [Tanacetum coccineum]